MWLTVEVNCLFAPVAVVCLDYCYQEGLKIQQPRPLRARLSAGGAYCNIFKYKRMDAIRGPV